MLPLIRHSSNRWSNRLPAPKSSLFQDRQPDGYGRDSNPERTVVPIERWPAFPIQIGQKQPPGWIRENPMRSAQHRKQPDQREVTENPEYGWKAYLRPLIRPEGHAGRRMKTSRRQEGLEEVRERTIPVFVPVPEAGSSAVRRVGSEQKALVAAARF